MKRAGDKKIALETVPATVTRARNPTAPHLDFQWEITEMADGSFLFRFGISAMDVNAVIAEGTGLSLEQDKFATGELGQTQRWYLD